VLAEAGCQEGRAYVSSSGTSAPILGQRKPCRRLAEIEQPREIRRKVLRTRDAQTLAESLPPLSTDVLEPIQHVRTSPFGFPLFESSVPVPVLDVFLSLLRLLVVAFPVLQLLFADL